MHSFGSARILVAQLLEKMFEIFNGDTKVCSIFPRSWRVAVVDRPKHDPFIPPDNGAIY